MDTHGPRAKRTFAARLAGALRLDATVYEEVEHDPTAMTQAAGVILLAGIAQGLAAAADVGFRTMPAWVVAAFLGWLLSTAVVWVIGAKAFHHTTDFGELLRTLGFASAPYLVLVLGILPLDALRSILWIAVSLLALAAFVVAVRQALDVGTGRAVLVCVLAIAAHLALGMVVGALSPEPAMAS
jgi:hypothetical protein